MVRLVGSVLEAVLSRACPGCFIQGPRPNGRQSRPKAESGGGVLLDGKEVASPSPSARVYGERCELPRWGSGRPPKGFPLFSALRMASPDTTGPTIVNCGLSCSYWGSRPRGPLVYAPSAVSANCSVSAAHRSSQVCFQPTQGYVLNYAQPWLM